MMTNGKYIDDGNHIWDSVVRDLRTVRYERDVCM